MERPTLVLGASTDPSRYAHRAAERLLDKGHPVLLIGKRAGEQGGAPIRTSIPAEAVVDTVTLYINPLDQEQWHDRILKLSTRRIILNPGTEHAAFAQRAADQGIEVVHGCTLVMLATDQY